MHADDAAPVATVSKAYSDVVFPIDADERKARDASGVKNVARRLRELLAGSRVVPRKLAGEVDDVLGRLLEAIGGAEEAA